MASTKKDKTAKTDKASPKKNGDTEKNSGGRPSKYSEKLCCQIARLGVRAGLTEAPEDVAIVGSGEISSTFNNSNDFKNEKAMCDYIESIIDQFCIELFDDVYVSHKREYKLIGVKSIYKGIPNIRVDFFIECKNNNYIVEIKNPVHAFSELTRAIGQMLMYDMISLNLGLDAKICIVSSKHEEIIPNIISTYNLNIGYYLFNKKNNSVFAGYSHG